MNRAVETSRAQIGSRERLFVLAVIFSQCLLLAHAVHTAWYQYGLQAQVAPVASASAPPVLYAPDAYRVGMPFLGGLEARLLHLHDATWIAALNDFCFAALALYLLYRLILQSSRKVSDSVSVRWARLFVFFALVQFPLAWIVPWQRPETTPACCFLAFAVFALGHQGSRLRWSAALMVATVVQGFIRADVAFIFGVAMALVSAERLRGMNRHAALQDLATAIGVTAIAGGIQAYLQFVRFPHLTYTPGIHPFQLINNFRSTHNLVTFGTASAPFVMVVGYVLWKRFPLDTSERVILVASTLYLALWWTVGSIGEVRLFVPFMMLLCVFAAHTLPRLFLPDAESIGELKRVVSETAPGE